MEILCNFLESHFEIIDIYSFCMYGIAIGSWLAIVEFIKIIKNNFEK